MKYTKKLLSLVLVLVLALALAVPGFAANITISQGNGNAVYYAYKLMDVESSGSNYAYEVNDKYVDEIAAQAGVELAVEGTHTYSENQAILEYVRGLNDSAEATQEFAANIFNAISGLGYDARFEANKEGTATFAADAGYWLIVEVKEDGGSFTKVADTLVMMDTTDINIIAKTNTVPTPGKTVEDANGAYQAAIDAAVGTELNYKLSFKLPNSYTAYDRYKVVLTDTMSEGIRPQNEEELAALLASIEVKVGGNKIESGYTVNSDTTLENGKLVITIEDLKTVYAAAEPGDEVTATYTTKLNAKAVIARDGNGNDFGLDYTNAPGEVGHGDADPVKVYTFDFNVNKVNEKEEPLTGAKFALYKMGASDYEMISEIDGTEATSFKWTGLSQGKYKLVETKAPEGYNIIDDILFEIKATYSGNDLTGLDVINVTCGNTNITADSFTTETDPEVGSASISIDVVNQTGLELPSTGGMGTTIFYTLGGVLVVGAAILLVTKKRVHDVEG